MTVKHHIVIQQFVQHLIINNMNKFYILTLFLTRNSRELETLIWLYTKNVPENIYTDLIQALDDNRTTQEEMIDKLLIK